MAPWIFSDYCTKLPRGLTLEMATFVPKISCGFSFCRIFRKSKRGKKVHFERFSSYQRGGAELKLCGQRLSPVKAHGD